MDSGGLRPPIKVKLGGVIIEVKKVLYTSDQSAAVMLNLFDGMCFCMRELPLSSGKIELGS